MSKKRQRRPIAVARARAGAATGGGTGDEHLLVRTYAVTHPPDLGIPERAYPDWDLLAYASRGVMTDATSQGTWVVPPHRAVWIPAAVIHSVQMSGPGT